MPCQLTYDLGGKRGRHTPQILIVCIIALFRRPGCSVHVRSPSPSSSWRSWPAGRLLCDVTRSTLVTKLIYASPGWWGYISNASKMRLQQIVQKLQKSGFLPLHFETVSVLCDSADDALFHSIPCPVPLASFNKAHMA